MENTVNGTIDFLLSIYPKIYSYFYLNHLKQYSQESNVNKTQLRALIFIKNNGPTSMTDLCFKLNIEKGSLTSMIDDLTDKEYVSRQRDIKDRRKYLINLTQQGDKIAFDFIQILSQNLELQISNMNDEDRADYIDAIGKFKRILSKIDVK